VSIKSNPAAQRQLDALADAREQLEQIAAAGLTRSLRCAVPSGATQVEVDGRVLVNFSSNDYLDLASNTHVVAAATEAAAKYGVGARASRLVTGNLPLHDELEAALAGFKGTEAALVFSSGYMANLGVIQAFSRRADGSAVPVLFDRLSHACIVDGALGTGRNWRSFPHNDVEALEHMLAGLPAGKSPRALVITEGVFSMDGDMAPLGEMLRVCEEHDALLIVDDAHGTGTIGPGGRGSVADCGVTAGDRLIQIGTLSKALGSQGGFVAASRTAIELLVNRARTFIFDTGVAAPCAAAALVAVRVIRQEPWRVEKLKGNARLVRSQLGLAESETPIVPVILVTAEDAARASEQLRQSGFVVGAIRPPTVPMGTSRLRVTVSCAHSDNDVRGLADAMRQAQGPAE
jgi:8-amino-7-oxononanoate synthase